MSREIKRESWTEFFNDFSRRNLARLTRVEIFGEMGAQEEGNFLPFNGVSVAGSGSTLEIMLGGQSPSDPRHLSHSIDHVTNVYAKKALDGRDEAIEFVDAEGTKTLLRFESKP